MLWHIAHDYDVSPFTFKLEKKAPFKFIDKKVAEYGIRTAHYIIAQTKQQKDLLQRYYGRLPTAIIPNFHPFPNEPIKKKEPIKIVYIANFKPSKRPELFVKLAEELAGYGNIQFMMIGRPGSRNKYRLLFERIARINNLKYKNELSIEEVNQVLAQSHIFVNTSVAEGFPNTFIQAWMRKVPVVSLNVDVDGILSTNEVGFHSKTYDNMRSHTIELIRNTRLRTRMGEKAQALAFRKYSMTNASQLVSLLSEDIYD
jgi:glycosyltransferase involved in cell wall biosynthesis